MVESTILEQLNGDEIKSYFERVNLNTVVVFGSLVNGEFNDASDIDIAILSEEKININNILKIELYLEDIFNRPIDVVDLNSESLDIFIKINILNNNEVIYSKDNGKLLSELIDRTEWYYRENEHFFKCRRRDLLS